MGKKNRTDISLNITKVIAPTVKTQANGQNDISRALKWGIVHVCILDTFRATL